MTIISFNGIERIGKSYLAGLLNKYLKEKEDIDVKKFSFPSYTTKIGHDLATKIKQFREDDLLFLNPHSHNRYKKIAELMVKNYEEYRFFIEAFLSLKNTYAIINNNYFSILAHGLAADVPYNDLAKTIGEDFFLKGHKTLAFFIVAKNVKDVIVSPFRPYETNYGDMITIETLSVDHLNYYTMVNNYYKQIYLSLLKSEIISPVYISVDVTNPRWITDTFETIKKSLSFELQPH